MSLRNFLFLGICLGTSSLAFSAIPSPLSHRDTTDRMNSGGDRVEHPGLRDSQLDPQYRDTWYGPRYWYYGENYRDSFRYWDPYRNNYYWGYDTYSPPGGKGYPYLDYNYSPGYNNYPGYDNYSPGYYYYDNRHLPY
jgi:hypothetical protein